MTLRRGLLLCLLLGWLPAVALLSPGDAQIRALSANTALLEPTSPLGGPPKVRIIDVKPVVEPADSQGWLGQSAAVPQDGSPGASPTKAALRCPSAASHPSPAASYVSVEQPVHVGAAPQGLILPYVEPLAAAIGAGSPLESTADLAPRVGLHGGPHAAAVAARCRTLQLLPEGLMFKSYLAGGREPRFAAIWFYDPDHGWLWDSTLGGRVGILRYGTPGGHNPQGWQIDIEGASFPRLDMERDRDLVSVDFRFGVPLTAREGPWETKFAFYHLSSHLGDEHMVFHASLDRINYSRDVLVSAVAYLPHPDLRLYAEAGWAFYTDGGTKPWEFQFGVDYSPARPTTVYGAPFFAVNGRIREEVDYSGNFTAQTGWQWRGYSDHLFRVGFHYFNGMSDQYQFFDKFEEQFGIALWYDH